MERDQRRVESARGSQGSARKGGGMSVSALKHFSLIAVGVVMIYPLLWMVSASLKPETMIFSSPSLLPLDEDGNFALNLDSYVEGWTMQGGDFGKYLLNSFIIVALCIIGNLMSCTMAAYGFSRLMWRGRNISFAIMMMTLMLPGFVLIVPQYIMWSQLGLVGTILPIVVPKFVAVDAFFVFMMVQFFRGIPRELDEAAAIDGAGYWRTFTRILLPIATPAIATTAIFTFIWSWNDFFSQLLYLNRDSMTATVALSNFVDATGSSQWGQLFAMSVVTIVPVFLVFLVGQRFLIQGIATTGLK
ncbi:carbohydrate ABC transporter permease [Demequina sp. NBRC 110055]|uniref:carbohydrate ABC transporter permease n=1 Tax=Demequina sp. NBRC 110055 TaxID=1570344 RepID=UPI001F458F3D|nr:carbohydrate ABC transporter permease [Demequina sp. NBRC 110055]